METVIQTTSVVPIRNLANLSDLSPADFADLDIFTPLGRGYRHDQVRLNRHPPQKNSHYYDQIIHPTGEPSGNSRICGDASREVQLLAMLRIVHYGMEENMSDHEIALTLAMV